MADDMGQPADPTLVRPTHVPPESLPGFDRVYADGPAYVFIDTAVPDYAQLAETWADRGVVVLIDSGRDGIDQMRAALAGVRDLSAIHVVSHGEQGAFFLGTTRIDQQAMLGSLGGSLAAIGRTLSDDGDMLIYGCDFGEGAAGHEAALALAAVTGADVAASVDDTGAAALGGDWTLEISTGDVTALALAGGSWDHLLATGSPSLATWSANGTTAAPGSLVQTLSGGGTRTIGLSISTGAFLNGGTRFTEYWDSIASTNDAVPAAATNARTGVNSYAIAWGANQTQTHVVNFSHSTGGVVTVTNPVLLFNFIDAGSETYTFLGATSLTLLDSNGLQRTVAGNQITTSGGNNQSSSGFAVRVNGTFSQSLSFTTRSAVTDSNGFTILADAATDIDVATTNTVPAAQTTPEDTPRVFSTANGNLIAVNDPDGADEPTTVQLTATNGTLTLSGVAGLTFTLGDGTADGTMTFSGTRAQVNAALNGLSYQPAPDYSGPASISISSTVAGVTDTDTVAVTVTPVNDAPVNTLPASFSGAEDSTVALTGLAIADADAQGGTMNVTLAVTGGALNAASALGVTVTGSGTASIGLSGTLANINTYLASANAPRFTPVANFNGAVTLTMSTTDNGNTGGGALTDTDTATITVTPVADAPLAVNDSATTNEDTPATINVLANDSDPDGDLLSVIAATAANGTVTRNADGTLTYAPNADFNGTDTITYTISDGNGGTATATVAVTVVPVDDAPVVSVPGRQVSPEDTDRVFSAANGNAITIADAEGEEQTVILRVTNGVLTLGQTTGVTFTAGDGTADQAMTFRGSLAAINAALDGLRFTPNADYNGPAQISVRTLATPRPVASFVNGGFEQPDNPLRPPSQTFFNEGDVPGWETDAPDGQLEYWDDGFFGAPAYEGKQFVELNARQASALFQNFTPTAGSYVAIGFAHRGRSGVDVMQVMATDLGADGVVGTADDRVLLNQQFADGNGPWGYHNVFLTEQASGNIIRFEFRAVSSATGDPTVGNFIDAVTPLEGKTTAQTIDIDVTPVADTVPDAATTNEDTAVTVKLLGNDNFENPGRAIRAIDGKPFTVGSSVAVANGRVTIDAQGVATFVPNANYNGTTSFTYTVTSNGTTETETATITVVPVNDAPVPVGTLAGRSDVDTAAVTLPTAGAFSDVDGEALTYSATGLPPGLTIDAATGVISGTIARDASQAGGGAYSVVVTARDAGGLTATQRFGWIVTNPAPVAANDTVATSEDLPVTIAVLANDVDPDGDPLTITAATAVNGTVVRNADGTLTYTPNASFNGSDTITYTISDGNGGSAMATVTVTVAPVNDAPVVVGGPIPQLRNNDSETISRPTAGWFSDADGDQLTYSATGLPPGLTIDPATGVISGTLTRDASQGSGPLFARPAYPVTVTATDASGASATQTFDWRILNPIPIAAGDTATTPEDTPVTIDVLANDVDPDGDSLQIIAARAMVGTVVINPDQTLTYTPPANYTGTVRLSYSVSDGNGGIAGQLVTVTVTGVPDAPVVTTPIADRQVADGEAVNLPVAASFTDVDGDALTYTATGLPAGLSIDPATGAITGTVANNASAANGGAYTVTVTATDPTGLSITDSFVITAVNPAPTAANDTATTAEDVPVTIAVLANDSDPDGDALTVTAANATRGTVAINPDGTITYTAPAGYDGTDTITYTISDGQGGTATATVAVTVTPVNDAPVAGVVENQAAQDGQAVSLPVATAFTDPDGDVLSYSVTGLPAGLSIDAATGVISGTIDRSASQANGGVYTVVVTASDGKGGTDSTSFTWTIGNPAPISTNDAVTTAEDTGVRIVVLANDRDADGDPLSVIAATAGNGTVTIAADGSLQYVPNPNFNGRDTIIYTITDSDGGRSTASVTVTVTPVNDTPVSSGLSTQSSNDGDAVDWSTAEAFSDPDGDPLTFSATGLPPGLSIDPATGRVTGTLPADASDASPYSVTIIATDPSGATVSTTIDWVIGNVGPTANDDAATTAEDTPVTIAVLGNDVDPDGDPLSVVGATATDGTVTVNPNGTLTFVPDADFNGVATITYTVQDADGTQSSASATVTVVAVNDTPDSIAIPAVVAQDGQAISLSVAERFSDRDGDALRFAATGLPAGLSIDPVTGVISGTVDRAASQPAGGVYSVTVTATDPAGAVASRTFAWTVTNPAPTAANDVATVVEDTPTDIIVLANDRDPDADPLTVVAAKADRGTVSITPDGTLRYTPAANFNGTDTITYTVSDGQGGRSTAVVRVTVTPVNDAPVANDLTAVTSEDAPISVAVVGNGRDVDGDPLTVTAATAPNGTVTINPDGTIAYTPRPNFNGTDTITYTVSDGRGGTATGTVTVTVNPVNDAPVVPPTTATVMEDTPVTIPVLAGVGDVDGDPLTVTGGSAPNGQVTVNPDGSITYVPNPDFTGTDTITYTVSDGRGGITTGTVTVTVAAVNDAPVADPLPTQSADEGAAVTGVATAGAFTDADGDTLTYSATGLPPGLSIDPTTGVISGTIDRAASEQNNGVYSVTVTARDPAGAAASTTFVWAVNNPAPLAVADTVTTTEDTAVVVPVLANDTDPDGDALSVVAAVASNGTVTINADGTITYRPNADFNGTDTITYTISDAQGGTSTAAVTVTVAAANDAPVVTDDLPARSVDEGTAVSIPTAPNFTDADGDALTFAALGLPAGLTIDPVTGVISGTVDRSASQIDGGIYTVTVTASDGNGGVVSSEFTLSVTNPAPSAIPDDVTTAEDTPVTIPVLANDVDPDGDPLTVTAATAANGTVTINPDGTITYVPNADFNGTDTITYTVSDGQGGFDTVTANVTVTAVNDAPTATPLPARTDVGSEVVTVPVAAFFRDVDGDALTFAATGLPAGLSIDPATGVVTGTIAPDASTGGPNGDGVFQVTVTASDGRGGTVSTTFAWTIANTAPNPVDDSFTVTEDGGPATLAVLANDTDPNGNPLTVIDAVASSGTVSVNPDGTLTFEPEPGFNGTVTIVYTVSDGIGGTATATATVVVAPVNDAPTAGAVAAQSAVDGAAVTLPLGPLFTDSDGDTLTFAATGLPAGLAIDPATGTIAGTVDPGASQLNGGAYTVTVTATDPGGLSTTVTFTWAIGNPAPVATDDVASTTEDTPVTVAVLANDGDPDGDALTIASASAANGTVTINPDGTITYVPAADFNGTDTITYTVSDGQGGTAVATVSVTVAPVNDAPTAEEIPALTAADGATVDVGLGGLFSDRDGDTLTFSAVGLPAGLSIDPATGAIVGRVAPDASQVAGGQYTVTVTASDGQGGTVARSFVLTITNPGPVAADDVAATAEDTPVTIAVLGNDTDADGDPLTVVEASAVNGTVVVNADGTVTYTPRADFNGSDTITYTVSDGQGGTAIATVSVTVTAVNDAPVAAALPTRADRDGQVIAVPVAGSFSDVDGDPLTFSATGLPAGLVIDPTTGLISGAIDRNASQVGGGVYVVTVTAVDGNGGTASTSFTWTVTNPGPVAANDIAVTAEDTPVTIGVLANDSDVDGDPLTVTAARAANGTVTINADGTISYVPNANFNGTDTITYTISDGNGGTATATVAVTVTPVNDLPVARNDAAVTSEDTPVTVAVLANDGDVDGDRLAVTAATAPNGTVTINADGTIRYVPNANFNGTDTITYTISDGNGGTATATVTVTVIPVNDPPVATPLPPRSNLDGQPVTVALGDAFSDVDGDPLTFSATGLPPGLAIDPATGRITGTIDASQQNGGAYAVVVTATDGNGGTVSVGFTWTITNPAPLATNDVATTREDTPVTIGVLGNDRDPDGDPLTVTTARAPNGTVTIDPDGTLRYVPNANFNGTDTITYTISDGQGGTATATATIVVMPVNDAPVDGSEIVDAPPDGAPVTVAVLDNASDADGNRLSVVEATAPVGRVVINPDGTLTYTPPGGFGGTVVVTYVVSDGNGGLTRSTLTLNFPAPGADVNALLDFGTVRWPEVARVDPTIETDGTDFEARPVLLDAVNGVRSLGGTPSIDLGPAVLDAVNGADWLRGTGALTGGVGPITEEVARLDRLRDLRFGFDRLFDQRFGDWYLESLTGFSARAAGGEAEQILVESVVRGQTIYLEMRDVGAGDDTPIAEFQLRMAGGRPLPDWIRMDARGLAIVERPPNVEELRLIVRGVREDGTVVELPIVIQGASGEIQIDEHTSTRGADATLLRDAMRHASSGSTREAAALAAAFGN